MNKDEAILNYLHNYCSAKIVQEIRMIQNAWNIIDKNISDVDFEATKTYNWQKIRGTEYAKELHRMHQDIVLEEYKDNKRRFPNLLDKNIIKIGKALTNLANLIRLNFNLEIILNLINLFK